jgi:very-short-patch-repair endonuclease
MVSSRRNVERRSQALNRSRAREMRREPVATEELFWAEVRNRKLGGYKFKRQFLIDPYIVDFVCLERRLIVELDGALHKDRTVYDAARDTFLRGEDYRVLRFPNEEVTGGIGTVLSTILHELGAPSPQPSPPQKRGRGRRIVT